MGKSSRIAAIAAGVFLSAVLSSSQLWSFQQGHQATEHHAVQAGPSADEALKQLLDSNQHCVTGKLVQHDIVTRRSELVKGQHPSAVVLSCSDSRVPPELIFDQGLGDIFVVRVAGNVVDAVTLGSIEYAVEHLNTPLIIVMGHDKCGAVSAAVQGGAPEGNIGSIVAKIAPSVNKAKAAGKKGDDLLDAAIIENVRSVTANLTKDSAIIKHLVEEKKVKIVPAKYNLVSGKVELL
ncbi:MAG TPA: carbonic anhydrase [Nitrospirota bacterium]